MSGNNVTDLKMDKKFTEGPFSGVLAITQKTFQGLPDCKCVIL